MTRERPLSILILGLVNLVVGGLCLFAGVAKAGRSLLFLALGPGQRENMYFGSREHTIALPDLTTYLELEIPAYGSWETGEVVAIFLAGVVVLAISYGLLHMRPWACWLALVYAVAILTWQTAYALFQIRDVLPVAEIYFLDESWRQYFWMPNTLGLARKNFMFFAGAQAVLLIGHAVLVLLVLWTPSVRAAFRGQADAGESAPAILSGTAPGSV
jgi:hypothetical protein